MAKQRNRSVRLTGNRLVITEDGEAQGYDVTLIASDDGDGFEVEKLDADGRVEATYHINLNPANGYSTCDCPGGTYRNTCKHLLALTALEKAGRLTCRRPVEVA